jgi:rare lipoprotein A
MANLAFSAEHGIASHYSIRSNGGTHTASGEKLRDDQLTAAHKTLPFGTVVKVTALRTGKATTVRITNRGPFIKGRIIDLSQAAAKELGIIKSGIAKVRVDIIKLGNQKYRKQK